MPNWLTDGSTIAYLFGGLATFVSALVGAVVILRKMGPEVSAVQVNSASQLVDMAKTAASLSTAQADRLSRQYSALEERNQQQAQDLGAALARIGELEKRAEETDRLREKVESLETKLTEETAAKEAALRESATLQERVAHLEAEVARLDSNGTSA